jgi:hypothetical protein
VVAELGELGIAVVDVGFDLIDEFLLGADFLANGSEDDHEKPTREGA